jgi:hypothetical protein
MNNNRTFLLSTVVNIIQIKSNWKLKVELNGCALMCSFESVLNGNVNLWSVEGAVTGILFPGLRELVQAIRQLLEE